MRVNVTITLDGHEHEVAPVLALLGTIGSIGNNGITSAPVPTDEPATPPDEEPVSGTAPLPEEEHVNGDAPLPEEPAVKPKAKRGGGKAAAAVAEAKEDSGAVADPVDIPPKVAEAIMLGYGPDEGETTTEYLARLQKLASDKSRLVGSGKVKETLATVSDKTLRQLADSEAVLMPAVERALEELK